MVFSADGTQGLGILGHGRRKNGGKQGRIFPTPFPNVPLVSTVFPFPPIFPTSFPHLSSFPVPPLLPLFPPSCPHFPPFPPNSPHFPPLPPFPPIPPLFPPFPPIYPQFPRRFTMTPATNFCFGFLPQVHIIMSRFSVHRCMHPVHSISKTFKLLQWNHDCVQFPRLSPISPYFPPIPAVFPRSSFSSGNLSGNLSVGFGEKGPGPAPSPPHPSPHRTPPPHISL